MSGERLSQPRRGKIKWILFMGITDIHAMKRATSGTAPTVSTSCTARFLLSSSAHPRTATRRRKPGCPAEAPGSAGTPRACRSPAGAESLISQKLNTKGWFSCHSGILITRGLRTSILFLPGLMRTIRVLTASKLSSYLRHRSRSARSHYPFLTAPSASLQVRTAGPCPGTRAPSTG